MYRVQYMSKKEGTKGIWKYVRKDGKIEMFTRSEARHCMHRCFNAGYNARIVGPDGKWIEMLEQPCYIWSNEGGKNDDLLVNR